MRLENVRQRSVPRNDWRNFYTPETLRHVEEIYATDFDLFGYERLSGR